MKIGDDILTVLESSICDTLSENFVKVSIRETTNSILRFEDGGIRLFPNPVRDQLWIEIPERYSLVQNNWELNILDLTGKELSSYSSTNTNRIELNVKSLPKGMYLCRFRYRDQVFIEKWVK